MASFIKLIPNVTSSKKLYLVLLLWSNAPGTHLHHGSYLSICTCQFIWTMGFSHIETNVCLFLYAQEEFIIGLTLSPCFHTNLVLYLSDSQGKEKALFHKTKYQNPLGGFPNQPQTWRFCCIFCKMLRLSPHPLGESLLPKSLHKAIKGNMFWSSGVSR